MSAELPITPYCGLPPTPANWVGQWNPDPPVIFILGLAWFWFARSPTRVSGLAGVGLLAAAFVSPLCALASALFSARVLHHLVLVAGAAPLLALALRLWLPAAGGTRIGGGLALGLHTATMWLWHAPAPYHWALGADGPYWVMELTLLGSAIWLWREILDPDAPAGRSITLALGAMMQMGLLGALLVFAEQPLYLFHLTTTQPFGLSPLEDQQLAGLLMWVPAALPFVAAALWRLRPLLVEPADTQPDASRRGVG